MCGVAMGRRWRQGTGRYARRVLAPGMSAMSWKQVAPLAAARSLVEFPDLRAFSKRS
jgi:hypothetical protein